MPLFRRRPDLVEDIEEDGASGRPSWAAADVWNVLTAPARWLKAAVLLPYYFLHREAHRPGQRTWGQVFGALPATLAAIGLTTFLVIGHYQKSKLPRMYEQAAGQAAAQDAPEAAVLYRLRLGELGRTDDADRFKLAAAMSEAGRDAEAFELLSGLLGGPDDFGYAPAHLLLAETLLKGSPQESDAGRNDGDGGDATATEEPRRVVTRANRNRALQHLAAAVRAAPDDDAVAARTASLSLKAGDAASAIPLMERLAEKRPEVWPDLMRVYGTLRRNDDAARAAAGAAPVLQEKLKRNPLDLETRVRLADAQARLGRIDDATASLAAGDRLHPDSGIPRMLATLYVAAYDRAVLADDRRLGRRLKLLQQALKVDPSFTPAMERLATFARTAAAGADRNVADPSAEEAEELLQGLLAQGEAPAGVHFALGLQALEAEDEEKALFHFDRAHRLDPALAAAANNIAFLLLDADQPDLERALRLADAAVSAAPNHPQTRHTRGSILAALDRPAEALTEYERAMEGGLRNNSKVRAEVADLYERLGQPAMAARFRGGSPPSTAVAPDDPVPNEADGGSPEN